MNMYWKSCKNRPHTGPAFDRQPKIHWDVRTPRLSIYFLSYAFKNVVKFEKTFKSLAVMMGSI